MQPFDITIANLSILLHPLTNKAVLVHRKKAVELVDNVSFSVPRGKIFGLIGPNGSGKSTILKTIYRYHKAFLGDIYFGSQEIRTISLSQLPKFIGVLPQIRQVEVNVTVEELIQIGVRKKNNDPDNDKYRKNIIEYLGLTELLAMPLRHLSGGQEQRAYLALAIGQDPGALILDEPMNHLDFSAQIALINLLRSLGKTIIIAIHDLNLAALLCDSVGVITRGRLVQSGSVTSVITPQLLREVFQINAHVFRDQTTGNLIISPSNGEEYV